MESNKVKKCCKCGEVKSISEFPRCKSKTDGFNSYCKECMKKYWIIYNIEKYGITCEQYVKILQEQNYICPICKNVYSTKHRSKHTINIDHDHITNKFRGIICFSCNVGIGQLNTVEKLEGAIDYFKTHQQKLDI